MKGTIKAGLEPLRSADWSTEASVFLLVSNTNTACNELPGPLLVVVAVFIFSFCRTITDAS